MITAIKFLGVVILVVSCLCVISTLLEIKAKRKAYAIIEKTSPPFMIGIIGLIVGIIGLLVASLK